LRKTAKTITIKLTDSERQKLEVLRGDRSVSAFIRSLLFDQHASAKRETEALQQLISDVATIRVKLSNLALPESIPDRDFFYRAFRGLGRYTAEVCSVGHKPEFKANSEYVNDKFDAFLTTIKEEEKQ
jgi:hypothetical protein